MTRYLSVEEALEIASADFIVADFGLFASALGRPQASAFGEDAYPDLWTKAAALCESLACNHALVEGNKRTALLLTVVFLGLNGWVVTADDMDDLVVAVATGHSTVAQTAEWLETNSQSILRTLG